MTDAGHFVTLGQSWNQDIMNIPTGYPSFGWHEGQYLILGDPFGEMNIDEWVRDTPQIGFGQFGPLVIIAIRSRSLPGPVIDCARPYLVGDAPPEITIEPGEHILWQCTTVSRGIVANMRAFTTSPRTTVYLRRALAEQRAHGPMTTSEADQWINQWQNATTNPKDVWRRMVVTCKAGD